MKKLDVVRGIRIGLRAALLYLGAMAVAQGPLAAPDRGIGDTIIEHARKPWTGDLDGMIKRGFIRILTTYNPLFFGYQGIEQRGLAVEIGREFESYIRKQFGGRARNLNVVLMPVPRDQLFPGLIAGRGDIAAANLTITPERKKIVAFSKPNYPNVRELVVTGPAAARIKSFDGLVAVGVRVRRSSSYFEHLRRLNKKRERAGEKPIPIETIDERLEDYDLLEMVNVGIIPAIIVDSHMMEIWSRIFPKITTHEGLAVNTGGDIGWAVRKRSRQLLKAVNGFNKKLRKGSLLGNILIKRYMNTRWIDNVAAPRARKKLHSVTALLQKYSGQYGFDWLKIAAQGYQESKLDQSKRSKAGAVGIMQVMPATAADRNVAISNIHLVENNIHAGVKYLRLIRETYFSGGKISPLNRVLLSFGAYNAGPGNISRARKMAIKMGLDPNRWFGHVEVAAARTISREPVTYVRNIYKYFVTYKKLEKARLSRAGFGLKSLP